MARPLKRGLDYFPFDVDFFSDPKIRILKSRYGADGITLYINLLCEIYKNGYYFKVDDDFEYIVSDDLRMDINKVRQIMNFLLERSLFDKKLFQSDKVITSTGIQKRFQAAVKERAKKNHINIKDYWILSDEETEPFIKVNSKSDISEKKADNSKKNNNNSLNYNTKESKEKKSNISRKTNRFCDYPQREHPDEYFKNLESRLLERAN